MLIKDILHDVVKKTQTAFMGGSSNKIPLETKNIDKIGKNEPAIISKFKDVFLKKDYLVKELRKFTDLRNNIDKLPLIYTRINERKFRINLVGNCGEHCKYALHYLIKNHSFKIFNIYKDIDQNPRNNIYITIYKVSPPYDHSFIHICYMTERAHSIMDEKTFLSIKPDPWICDPWADIICRGSEYLQEWKIRMTQWNNNNMCVIASDSGNFMTTDTGRYPKFLSPLRPNVYNIISDTSHYVPLKTLFIDNRGNIQEYKDNGEIISYNIRY
ncbi:hypothetical protein Xbed_02890 [Xenorhabdus beddingii]|uniref:Uncharacterized protein n=1 Tax=Xenorhabdus beddingii TaxID=40578 RepID=A0A1Y2SLH6_9GAMM|nr:hypothetical protein [Xenorhabdus beddingii]OTA18904.1 hypothetical protein Xbed_02890 [Xenorhabdus beddingii]